ncbi:MAG: arylsulfatase [Pirellulaceae bacterium]|nr:arylsulfatase [Pirellulaceae bacterium]
MYASAQPSREAGESARISKPSVIYIMADDLGIGDVGAYGGKIIQTPNIDRLARQGLKFTQHYSGSTVCAPSRSVLMTGQHTGHTRVRGNSPGWLLQQDVTVAEIMQQAGYVTGAIGKWGLGSADNSGAPWKQGFQHYFGYLSQTNAHHYYPEFLWRDGQKVVFPDNPIGRTHYSHDLFTNEALAFIRRYHTKPFFLYLPYTIPHVDLDVPDDSKTPYVGKLGSETPYGQPGGQHYRHEPRPRATFAGMVSRMDRDIGTIIELLEELKIDDQTLVVFCSDNGATSAGGADPEYFDGNGPYRGIKRDLYEGGIITPMIARWPGTIAANSQTDHLSGFQDLLPTLAELVNLPAPDDIDGISYLPTLLGNPSEQKQHDYLYWEFVEQGGKRALRKGDWKLVQLKVSSNKPPRPELYDLHTDPAETTDRADEHPDVAERLIRIMDSAHTPSARYPLFRHEGAGMKRKR